MKYLIFIFVIFVGSANARSLYDHDCSEFGYASFDGDSFGLNIDTSFNGQVNFQVAKSIATIESEHEKKKEVKYYLIVTKSSINFESDLRKITHVTSCENKEISEAEYKKIFKLYKGALTSNYLDKVMGLDGSIWCLEVEPDGMLSRKMCFWTPSTDTKKRNLEGLYNLGQYLWNFSGLPSAKEFELY